jgi:hypothetical protein
MESTHANRRRYFRPRNVLLAVFGIGVVAYVLENPAKAATGAGGDELPMMPGFVSHEDPAGFSVQVPEGWQVAGTRLDDVVITGPGGGSAAWIRPRVVRGDLTRWLAEDYLRTEPTIGRFQMTAVSAESPSVARATFTLRQGDSDKRASIVAVRSGEIATVFVAMAPTAEFPTQLPSLIRILDSFRFTRNNAGSPGARPRSRMQFVQWVEPYEQAFSMEIPAGWQPQGGLLRRVDGVRVVYQLTSPDGAAFIFGGDQAMPAYFVFPTEIALSLGNREGQPTNGNGPIMLRFQDAASMGQSVIQQRFGRVQITAVRQRADLIEIIRRNPVMHGSVPQASAAEIEFTLADGRVGMLALTTQGQEVQGLGGTWYVDNIHGFVAPAERASETGMALARAIGTSRENPRWRTDEAAHQARMTAQYQEYVAYSAGLQRQTIEARWASDVARQGDMRDILGGTVRLKDPVTGESFETGGQNRYYYRVVNGAGNTGVGTDTDFNPAPELDMRRLLQVGVDIP